MIFGHNVCMRAVAGVVLPVLPGTPKCGEAKAKRRTPPRAAVLFLGDDMGARSRNLSHLLLTSEQQDARGGGVARLHNAAG